MRYSSTRYNCLSSSRFQLIPGTCHPSNCAVMDASDVITPKSMWRLLVHHVTSLVGGWGVGRQSRCIVSDDGSHHRIHLHNRHHHRRHRRHLRHSQLLPKPPLTLVFIVVVIIITAIIVATIFIIGHYRSSSSSSS